MARSASLIEFRRVRLAAQAAAAISLGPASAAGQLTPELLARVEWIEETAISPDGRWVAYVRSTPAPPGGAFRGRPRELFLIPGDGGTPRRLASAQRSPRKPAWSADGRHLAFLAIFEERDSHQQVYQISLGGGEPRLLTRATADIRAFAFSPDDRSLAYLAPEQPPDSVLERQREGYDAVVVGQPGRPVRLWVKAVDSGHPRPITPANRTVWSFAWSPDGSRFALQVTENTDRESDWNFRQLCTVPVDGGEPVLLTRTEGPLGSMAWSPDGQWLAFIGSTSLRDKAPESVFVVPAGGGEAVDRTAGYEGSALWVGWLDADTVLFGAIEGTRTWINRVSTAGGSIERRIGSDTTSFVFLGFNIDAGISLDARARTFAAPIASATRPDELHVGTTDGRRLRRLTNHNEKFDGVRFGRQERIQWESTDGLTIEGILVYPLDERPERHYPLVVMPHGGPEMASLDAYFGLTWPQGPVQVYAAQGYAVLAPNFRGSLGRGVAFSRANQRDLGGKELDDILRGIDHLVAKGVADSSRVAIHGMSYGGYLAALAAGLHSRRFKAAIASAPVTNWMSYIGWYDNALHETLAHWDLWWYEHPGLLWDRSPVAHIHRNWTPLLIDHGEVDDSSPPFQSQELYQALRFAGAPVRLVLFPREGHEYVEEPHMVDVMHRYLEWLDLHLSRPQARH